MNSKEKLTPECYTVSVYGDYFEQGENVQTYSVSSKETAKQLIQKILRRNHLDLKDPNLFYLTFKIDPVNVLASYESNLGNRPNGHLNRSGKKYNVGTLYSDAILSRTLNLSKDNKLTLEMQEGGMLRIYDNCFSRPPSIRQLYISKTTCCMEAIKLVLTIVGSTESAENYCLVEEEPNDRGRILRPTDYPLLVTRSGSLNSVLILRRIEDALRNEKTRKKPWLTRSKTFACGSTTDKNSEAGEVNQQAIGSIRRNLLPRFLKSFRRNKTLDSLRGNADIEEALLQTDQQTPSPFVCGEKTLQKLPNGSPFQSTLEEKLVTSSLANPHYLSAERNINRTRTSAAPTATPAEVNQSASNWSLSPSACMSLPSSARNFSTSPARPTLTAFAPNVTRLGQCESTQNRKYNSPRPPQRACPGVQTHPRPNNSILTPYSFVKPPTAKVIQFSSSNDLSCPQSSPKHSVNKFGIRPGPETLAADLLHSQRQFLNSSGQTPAEDSPTELERVWARKKLTKYKHNHQTTNKTSADATPTTSATTSKGNTGYLKPESKPLPHEYDSPPECSGDVKSTRSSSSPGGRTDKRSSPITLIDASDGERVDPLQSITPLSDGRKKHVAGNYVQSTTWRHHQETVKSRKTTRFHSSNQIYTINGFPGVSKLLQETPAKNTVSSRRLTLPTRFDSDFRSSASNTVENKTETSVKLQNETLKSDEIASKRSVSETGVSSKWRSSMDKCEVTKNNDKPNNVASLSTEKMITLTAKFPNYGQGRAKSTSQLTTDTPNTYEKSMTSHHQLIHQKQSEEKATTNMKFSPLRLTPSKLSFPQTHEKWKRSVGDFRQTEEDNLAVGEKSSVYMSSASSTKYTSWSSHQPIQQDGINPLEPASSFPTLFDILHHCNINRVLLDPNIPSSNNQLGLRLCLTKFPLDDIQRANHLQRMKEAEIKGISCSDYERADGFNSAAGPQGPKPQLLPRHGGPFRPVDYRRLEDAPDVITIESIQPNTPASIEGSLSAGMLILEINGQQLLHPKGAPKGGSRMSMLRMAEDQLRMAYQAAKHGQVPMVRITAARFHNKFGTANQLARWNRFSRLGIPESNGKTEQEENSPEPKLPNSLVTISRDPSRGRAPRKSTRRDAPNAFSPKKYPGSDSSRMDTYSPSENATDATSTAGNTDAESIREKLMWFPSWTVPCKQQQKQQQQQQQQQRRKMQPPKLHWGTSTARNGDYDSQYSTFTK